MGYVNMGLDTSSKMIGENRSRFPQNFSKQCFIVSSLMLAIISGHGLSQTSEIESIIVTGQKIDRSLQETTASVAVITSVQIEEKNINNFSDVLIETANAHPTAGGGFSIRGINGFNVSGGGNSYLASIYVDGASVPQRMIYGGGFSTWDVSQVEVFRGPQSTLQGRNALAGAVIMNTQAPSHEWNGKYRLQAGGNDLKEAAIAFGGSVIRDQLSFRFSGENKETDGFTDNIVRNESSDYREDELYRLKLLLEPEALPGFSAQLGLTHSTNTHGAVTVEVPTGGNPFDRITTNNDINEQYFDADMVTLEMNYKFSDNWDIKSVSTWSNVDSGYELDSDNFPTMDSGGTRTYINLTETLSQEFRLTFDYDRFSGIVGAYYFETDIYGENAGYGAYPLSSLGLTSAFLQGAYGLDATTGDLVIAQYSAFDPARTIAVTSTQQDINSYALFSDFTYHINESWDFYGGVRWDHESQANADDSDYTIVNADELPDPASYSGTPLAALAPLISGLNDYIFSTAEAASQTAPLINADFDAFLPKLGLSYHWTDELLTSFTWQKGYRSGGVGINSAQSTIYQYDPEYTSNYELAVRSRWLDGSLIANVNLFYTDWDDQQVRVQLSANTFDSETLNAGKSTVRGFEIEVSYQLTDELKIYSSLGQAKSKFTDFTVIIPTSATSIIYELSGRSFADSPEWTGNIGMTYSGYNGIFGNVSVNYANSSPSVVNPWANGFSEDDAGFDLQNDDRTLVDLQLGYEWEKVGIYLVGSNIFDEEYVSDAYLYLPALGAPRQISLSIRGNF